LPVIANFLSIVMLFLFLERGGILLLISKLFPAANH
jgi:hypothetical protein